MTKKETKKKGYSKKDGNKSSKSSLKSNKVNSNTKKNKKKSDQSKKKPSTKKKPDLSNNKSSINKKSDQSQKKASTKKKVSISKNSSASLSKSKKMHGVIHHMDNKHTYLKVHHKHLSEHKHYFPGNHKTKIVPAKKRSHHDHYYVGEKVHFNLGKMNNILHLFLYYSAPILGIAFGIIIATLLSADEVGYVIFMILFMFLSFLLRSFYVKYHDNIFREIDVILHPKEVVSVYNVRSKDKQ